MIPAISNNYFCSECLEAFNKNIDGVYFLSIQAPLRYSEEDEDVYFCSMRCLRAWIN